MDSETKWEFINILQISLYGHYCNHPTTMEHQEAKYTMSFMNLDTMEIHFVTEKKQHIPNTLYLNKHFIAKKRKYYLKGLL